MKSYYHHIFFLIVFCFSLYFARYIPAEQASPVVGLIAMIVTFFHGLQSIAYLSTGLRSRSSPTDSHQKFSATASIGAQYGIVCGAGFLTGGVVFFSAVNYMALATLVFFLGTWLALKLRFQF